ncbi:hypothetical protein ACWEV4_21715 [Streptomyces sp. NPDC003860]
MSQPMSQPTSEPTSPLRLTSRHHSASARTAVRPPASYDGGTGTEPCRTTSHPGHGTRTGHDGVPGRVGEHEGHEGHEGEAAP